MTSKDMTPQEVKQRVDVLRQLRKVVEEVWDDVERYVMPLRLGQFNMGPDSEESREWNRDDLYDTTAIFAAQTMSSHMHGSITNPVVKWFNFLFQDPELQQDPESANWLQVCTERVYAELYNSNFDSEISSAYQDLVGPGNACLFVESESDDPLDWKGFNFAAIPVREFFFEQDHRGQLSKFYRDLQWTARQIVEKFRTDEYGISKFPKCIQEALKTPASLDKKFNVVFAVYCRDNKYKNRGKYPLAAKERPYGAKYVLTETCEELGGTELGYYRMPAYLTRFEKTSGSMWGFGPGVIMAPTAKYINKWMEIEQQAVLKMLEPVTLVTERALLSDLDQKPGGLVIVRDINGIKVHQAEGRVDFSKMELKELREMIRAAFKVDELQLKESPQMSATEAQIRYELMNRVLGPTLARLQTDMFDPLLMRNFQTLLEMKQFPPMPKLVLKKKGQLKIDYAGPLMRAQKTDEVAAIERFIGMVGGMAKVVPTVLNVIDPVKVVREMAERLGVPMTMLRSSEEVAKLVKGQQELAAQQAKAALMQQHGQGQEAMAKGAQAAREVRQNGAEA
jgi:hypothetical protein